jgi:hypothetical protein
VCDYCLTPRGSYASDLILRAIYRRIKVRSSYYGLGLLVGQLVVA